MTEGGNSSNSGSGSSGSGALKGIATFFLRSTNRALWYVGAFPLEVAVLYNGLALTEKIAPSIYTFFDTHPNVAMFGAMTYFGAIYTITDKIPNSFSRMANTSLLKATLGTTFLALGSALLFNFGAYGLRTSDFNVPGTLDFVVLDPSAHPCLHSPGEYEAGSGSIAGNRFTLDQMGGELEGYMRGARDYVRRNLGDPDDNNTQNQSSPSNQIQNRVIDGGTNLDQILLDNGDYQYELYLPEINSINLGDKNA